MAQQATEVDAFWEQLSAPYPPPPPFWKHFTASNQDRLHQLESQSNFDAAELPYELLVLRPPPLPKHGSIYATFDKTHSIVPEPTLPPEQEELLFDRNELSQATGTARPHARLLWQLTKSLSLNLLELFTIMAENPVEWQDKINDIGTLMENINTVLNLLRPHQAREQLKTTLLNRCDAGIEEIQRCDAMKTEVEAFLQRIQEAKIDSSLASDAELERNTTISTNIDQVERARKKWASIQSLPKD